MKLGTIVELPDGRRGTVTFNGLCGVGIKWGEHDPNPTDFDGSHGDIGCTLEAEARLKKWLPDAYLRDVWPNADLPCVGHEFVVIRKGGAA